MAAATNTFTVKTNIIQHRVENVSQPENLSHHIALPYNFGVAHLTMPKSSIRRVPFHILFSLDNSGSMSADLQNVKETLYNILEYLLGVDVDIYVSVQYFNSSIHLIFCSIICIF